ncbi:MAG TPA: serine/threonine-protein kinase, partial [Planctomycetia bacterium]|nr:serine/threonine-protein kinase [Planctomycetia bacterium]
MSNTADSFSTLIGPQPGPEDRFASAWMQGSSPELTEFLPQEGDEGYLTTLERLVQIEIEQSWRRSSRDGATEQPQLVEAFLARFPVLRTPEAIPRLARAEFLIRSQLGDNPEIKQYLERFPGYVTVESASEWFAAAREVQSQEAAPGDLGTLGDYKLLEQVGEGGMGVVYRALQPGANRVVALKVIRSSVTGAGESFRKKAESRFKNEIQAAAQLEHENIVPVYDVGNVGDLMYFAMRFVEGQSLSDLVMQGPVENRLAATYIAGTTRGVAEAHRRGILHRDLKPHNVMIESRSGKPMVADFGLAKLVDGEDQITKTGETIGTPSYMPPEQIKDATTVDHRGDVYSLGATLYHLLAGRPPFQAANTLGTMRQVLYDEAAPPRRLNSAVDADLDTICLKCLQKEPVRRYQSAQELADDLERYLRGEPILARPIGRLERLNRWRRRNPVEAGLTAAAILLAATALAATTIGYRNTKAALAQARQNLDYARSAVDRFYTEVSEIDLQNQPGLQPLKQRLLARALDYYQKFLEENRCDTALSVELADSHFRVGEITEEIKSVAEALPHFEAAAKIQQALLKKSPKDLKLTEALSDSFNSIGRVQQRRQNYSAAKDAYDESRRLRTSLVTEVRDNRGYQRKLANVQMNSGLLKSRQQEFDAAAAEYEAAQEIRRKLLDAQPETTVTRDFARGAYNQGVLEENRENLDRAAAFFETAIEKFKQLVEGDPEDLSNRYELAVASARLGDVLALQGELSRAPERFEFARTILVALASENPRVIQY